MRVYKASNRTGWGEGIGAYSYISLADNMADVCSGGATMPTHLTVINSPDLLFHRCREAANRGLACPSLRPRSIRNFRDIVLRGKYLAFGDRFASVRCKDDTLVLLLTA